MTGAPRPSEGTPQQKAQTKKQKQLVTSIIALFASGAVGYGLLIGIRSALLAYGLPLEIALWLAEMTSTHTTFPNLGLGKVGPMQKAEEGQALAWRAIYILGAAERLANATDIVHAEHVEEGYFARHVAAEERRVRAAALVDVTNELLGDRTEERTGVPLLGWRAVIDARTTPECAWANGQNFRADRIPVIGIPGGVHPRCFPAGTAVVSPGVAATSMRWYEGEIIEILTDGGDFLAVTPNHPILTSKGWVPAGLINDRCEVVSTRFGEALASLVDPDNYQSPALIEDVVSAFNERLGVLTTPVPISPEDFHGDGAGSDVAVVGSYGALVNDFQASEPEPRRVQEFVGVSWNNPVTQFGSSASFLESHPSSTHRDIRRERIALVLLGRAFGHHQSVGLSDTSALNSFTTKDSRNGATSDAEISRDFVLAHTSPVPFKDVKNWDIEFIETSLVSTAVRELVGSSLVAQSSPLMEGITQHSPGNIEFIGYGAVAQVAGLIHFDRVRQVRRRPFWSGHVFNLESSAGWYVSNNILVHNCRCTSGPPIKGAPLIPSV